MYVCMYGTVELNTIIGKFELNFTRFGRVNYYEVWLQKLRLIVSFPHFMVS